MDLLTSLLFTGTIYTIGWIVGYRYHKNLSKINSIKEKQIMTLQERLDDIVAPEHPWFDPKKAVENTAQQIEKDINALLPKIDDNPPDQLLPDGTDVTRYEYRQGCYDTIAELRLKLKEYFGTK